MSGRLDGRLVTADGFLRLPGNVMDVGAMAQDPGFQDGVLQLGILVC